MNTDLAQTNALDDVHADIALYYTKKIVRYGPTAAGVDWSCSLTQEMRFVQLLKLCDVKTPLSINDLGCGYGALVGFISRRHRRAKVNYWGVDLSSAMVSEARKAFNVSNAQFSVGGTPARCADYTVASGIFNVKLEHTDEKWTQFIQQTLDTMRESSRKGFAVNFLTPLPGGETGKPELYRAPPELWYRHCKEAFGANVTVVENYGMREYTLLVSCI